MNLPSTPGTTFRFVVGSADQAAQLIRDQLGDRARVLSVRNVEAGGVLGLFRAPKLEVVVQIAAPDPAEEPAPVAPAAPEPAGAEPKPAPAADRRPAPTNPLQLPELLRRSGFSEKVLLRLAGAPVWASVCEMPLHRALVVTGRYLLRTAAVRREPVPLSRAAFIGTHGSGRTTALCKWLSREVFRRARLGHVITAEFDRPNPVASLPVYCEALGVPLAHFPASTEPATPGGFVYFDLPAISLRRPDDNAALRQFLDGEKIRDRVLVLNAAYDHSVLRAAYAAGVDLGATHVVFTHMDEVAQWGRLWDYLLDGQLTPLFLATGPSLSGDLAEDPLDAVAGRTLPMDSPEGETDEPEEPAVETGENLTAAA